MYSPESHDDDSSTSQSPSRIHDFNINAHRTETSFLSERAFVEIIEQPASVGVRFRYKCEGRSAGCIRGASSSEKLKTYPTIKVCGYRGNAAVVVSCITKDGPPYYPHPHNLVGKQTCGNGVAYKQINSPDMICSFPNLGIQCVKKKDIKESLLQRQALKVDPFGTGFSHCSQPSKINLNALRLCFQVFIADNNGKITVPLAPVISDPIFDNKTVSDLNITKLSHYSAPAVGGQEIILLCDQVNKDDIQIVFYEYKEGNAIWKSYGTFLPHNVHRKAAISFTVPAYKTSNIASPVDVLIQLRRPSDGAVGRPRKFSYLPLKRDPEGLLHKKQKFEALKLDRFLYDMPINNGGQVVMPRTIKHAVRSFTKSNAGHLQSNIENSPDKKDRHVAVSNVNAHFDVGYVPHLEHNKYKQIIEHNENVDESVSMLQSNINEPNPNSSYSCQQKTQDILSVAAEQIGLNNVSYENYGENALERLSNLDLGFEPSDLDINLNEISFDSLSESFTNNTYSSTSNMKCCL